MKAWFALDSNTRKEVITQTSIAENLVQAAIEKDYWVMIVLRAIFNSKYANQLVFKGGTSLSKAWGLIDRFSEDIDLGIDREYFGFTGDLKRKEVTELRKKACAFVSHEFVNELKNTLTNDGVEDFDITILEFERSDTDPVAIAISYKSLVEDVPYIQPRILVEISARSLKEPFENRDIQSFVSKKYAGNEFADALISIPTVLPTRTLLEKLFLLHEEFQKPEGRLIRSERMTRHLYDISRLMDTEHLENAINDKELFETIVKHREMLTNVSWVDYSLHTYKDLNFIPPETVIDEWKKDYNSMRETMIYGDSVVFEELIKKMKDLKIRINNL
jgi:Nucleotidyl transferase AbiEii toxin, Type IV TA system